MNGFMFYDNFLFAIEQLPPEEQAKACLEFCKYGITGALPEDKSVAMFCVGVSASVHKYQGRGGIREGAGALKGNQNASKNNQKQSKTIKTIKTIKNNQNNQNAKNNQNAQTETETKTETKTKISSSDDDDEIETSSSSSQPSQPTGLKIFLVDGTELNVTQDWLESEQASFPDVDARAVFTRIQESTRLQKAKRPSAETLPDVVERWFRNLSKDARRNAMTVSSSEHSYGKGHRKIFPMNSDFDGEKGGCEVW